MIRTEKRTVSSSSWLHKLGTATCVCLTMLFGFIIQAVLYQSRTLNLVTTAINNFQDRAWTVAAGISGSSSNISVPDDTCGGRFPAVAHEKKTYGTFKTSMPVHPLDYFFDIDGRDIMLMKVDTEGNEKRVLDGAMEFFRHHKIRNAIVEVTPGVDFWKNEGISVDEVMDVLKEIYSFGYRVSCLDDLKIFSNATEMEYYIRTPVRQQMDFWFSIDEDVLGFNTTHLDLNLLSARSA